MQLNQRKIMLALGSISVGVAATQLIRSKAKRGAVTVGAITINAPADEVFACLSDAEINRHAFGDLDALSDAELEPHRLNELLAWERQGKARAMAALKEAPGSRGTEIHMTVRGYSKEAVKAGLRRFKALVEAREVPTGDRT